MGAGVATGAAVLLALGGTVSVVAAEEGTIRGADAVGAIDGSYIVVLKEGVATAAATNVAQQYDAEVRHVYSNALNGFSASMSETAATRAAADPAVAYVEQNRVVHTMADQADPASWGLDRIDQRERRLDGNYSYSGTGSGVEAYVIDTGIRVTHDDFEGRARPGYDFIDDDADSDDCHGHGTHVAGTVGGSAYGVAKEVDLIGVRVLDCEGSGTNDVVIAGIDWVTENADGPAVANMSLGGDASEAVNDAVRRSIDAGVTYAIAAGNDFGADACGVSPAGTEEAITVGAISRIFDVRALYSNTGPCLDIFAPGSGITSAGIEDDSAERSSSGTSMAAPHVAGAAALYLGDNPSATPQEVRDALVDNGTKDSVIIPGAGSPNVLLYTGVDG